MALHSLDAMAAGELRDPVEHGFFRYATRRDWSAPHYEKLLDDNARLALLYLDAFAFTGRAAYAEVAAGTLDYLTTVLRAPDAPVFFGSQDADEHYYGYDAAGRDRCRSSRDQPHRVRRRQRARRTRPSARRALLDRPDAAGRGPRHDRALGAAATDATGWPTTWAARSTDCSPTRRRWPPRCSTPTRSPATAPTWRALACSPTGPSSACGCPTDGSPTDPGDEAAPAGVGAAPFRCSTAAPRWPTPSPASLPWAACRLSRGGGPGAHCLPHEAAAAGPQRRRGLSRSSGSPTTRLTSWSSAAAAMRRPARSCAPACASPTLALRAAPRPRRRRRGHRPRGLHRRDRRRRPSSASPASAYPLPPTRPSARLVARTAPRLKRKVPGRRSGPAGRLPAEDGFVGGHILVDDDPLTPRPRAAADTDQKARCAC